MKPIPDGGKSGSQSDYVKHTRNAAGGRRKVNKATRKEGKRQAKEV